ncbi:MAG: serine/threonine protein kinase [Kofleriaceae bacterium]|nr:serine/threonine protein kinase [Kofleriaceae bacterium]
MPWARELTPGTRVDRYEIVAWLGAGGMGVVYEAFDPELRRRVALKLVRAIRPGATWEARLLREAQAMAQLSHPAVVPVFDVGSYDGGVFVAMELVDGGTLKGWLQAERRSWRAALTTLIAAGRGLAAAHAAGLVHRDFKPDNVLVGKDGRVRVTDFGLARIAAADTDGDDGGADVDRARPAAGVADVLSRPGAIAGTPAYMAPETAAGVADARSDQFAFCVTLYEALYGERPFAPPAGGDPGLVTTLRQVAASVRARPRPPPRGRRVRALAARDRAARRRRGAGVAVAVDGGAARSARADPASPRLGHRRGRRRGRDGRRRRRRVDAARSRRRGAAAVSRRRRPPGRRVGRRRSRRSGARRPRRRWRPRRRHLDPARRPARWLRRGLGDPGPRRLRGHRGPPRAEPGAAGAARSVPEPPAARARRARRRARPRRRRVPRQGRRRRRRPARAGGVRRAGAARSVRDPARRGGLAGGDRRDRGPARRGQHRARPRPLRRGHHRRRRGGGGGAGRRLPGARGPRPGHGRDAGRGGVRARRRRAARDRGAGRRRRRPGRRPLRRPDLVDRRRARRAPPRRRADGAARGARGGVAAGRVSAARRADPGRRRHAHRDRRRRLR